MIVTAGARACLPSESRARRMPGAQRPQPGATSLGAGVCGGATKRTPLCREEARMLRLEGHSV